MTRLMSIIMLISWTGLMFMCFGAGWLWWILYASIGGSAILAVAVTVRYIRTREEKPEDFSVTEN